MAAFFLIRDDRIASIFFLLKTRYFEKPHQTIDTPYTILRIFVGLKKVYGSQRYFQYSIRGRLQ